MEPTLAQLLQQTLTASSPMLAAWRVFWHLFTHGGWVIVLLGLWLVFWHYWHLYIWEKWDRENRKWILLAIDIPKDNEQSPKAVENIFAHLAGGHGTLTWVESHIYGATQDWFSLEVVGIEGSVQFIIRTTERFRDLVEAAIYGQYPDAEIIEIEDYTKHYPSAWPNDRYQMYGTEFYYVEDQALPIRTYPEFEHQLQQEFKDPMQALLETMNKLGPGEQLWFQINIEPIDNSWKKPAIRLMKQIQQGDKPKGPGLISNFFAEIFKFGHSATDQVGGGSGILTADAVQSGQQDLTSLFLIPPDAKAKMDGIALKVKKIGYMTKIRSVYIAKKERYQAAHGREALVGFIKQFNTEDMNALRPDTGMVGVHAHYYLTDWRKNWKRRRLMANYKDRSVGYGRNPQVMNIEELASLWHFPIKTDLAPMRHMVQRTEFKHTPPPTSLPYVTDDAPENDGENKHSEPTPPVNLPTI